MNAHIGLEQGIAGQLARSAARGAKERPFAVLGNARGLDVLLQIAVEVVVGRHLVLLTALHKVPLDLHLYRRCHASEGVDHQPDQRSVAQTGKGSGVDRVDQSSGFVGLQHRRLAAPL